MSDPAPGTAPPAAEAANPFDLHLPMVGTAPDPPPADTEHEHQAHADHGADQPEPIYPPEPVESPAHDAEDYDIDDDEDYDADESDQQAWRHWLGEDPAPDTAQGPIRHPSAWYIPDYDAPEDPGGGAAVLVDRSGGRNGTTLVRRRRRADSDPDRPRRGTSGFALSAVIGVGLAVIASALVINFVIMPARPTSTAAPTPDAAAGPSTPVMPAPADDTTDPAAPDPAAVATPGCVQSSTSGTGTGGTSDGPSAILAFEHAYYVQKSGTAARAAVAPDADVPAAAAIQAGVDQVPSGTRYCVQIRPAAAGGGAIWSVDLTEQWPGQAPVTYHQSITTGPAGGGRTLITAIGAGTN